MYSSCGCKQPDFAMRPGESCSPQSYDGYYKPYTTSTFKQWCSRLTGSTPGINDPFPSIGRLKDGTQAILLSLQRIPFVDNPGHFGQYLPQTKFGNSGHSNVMKWAHRESATQLASMGSSVFLVAVRGAVGDDAREVRHNLPK
jgi:hypothetical protein